MFIHAVQIAAITVYIMFGPPKMELLPVPMYFTRIQEWQQGYIDASLNVPSLGILQHNKTHSLRICYGICYDWDFIIDICD